jgi:hypothetical protein
MTDTLEMTFLLRLTVYVYIVAFVFFLSFYELKKIFKMNVTPSLFALLFIHPRIKIEKKSWW